MDNTRQPSFHCVANLGDFDPFEYGGRFLMIDRRGIRTAELWVFSEWAKEDPTMKLHKIVLDICFPISFDDGCYHLGGDKHHPHHRAWFGDHKEIESLARFTGMDSVELRHLFCGNPWDRAIAYAAVADYHGLALFDESPTVFKRKKEARDFCDRMLSQIAAANRLPDGCDCN